VAEPGLAVLNRTLERNRGLRNLVGPQAGPVSVSFAAAAIGYSIRSTQRLRHAGASDVGPKIDFSR
jgi:hypothetical protein